MTIGYARVSTREQNLDMQLDALRAAGCEVIYQDKLTGKDTHRPELQKMLKQVRRGDLVIVWKLDRLGRSLLDLLKLLEDWEKEEIKFRCLTQPVETASPMGRLILSVLGAVAELERSLIAERAEAGRKRAKELGVKFGPKFKLSVHQIEHLKKLKERGDSPKVIALVLGISESTVFRALRRLK